MYFRDKMTTNKRYLVIGDLHIKGDNLQDISSLHARILSLIPDVDEVVILGDTLDRHGTISMQPLAMASRMIKAYSDILPVRVLIGNHDRLNNTVYCTNESPFIQWSLIPHPNITIVDKPIQLGNVLFVPYVPPDTFQTCISEFDLTGIQLIFAHQEFAGCKYNGITSSIKEGWSSPIRIVSGHIHECQEIGNVLYTGTPLQNDFNESPHKYLFYVNLGETVTYTAIPISSVPKVTIRTKLPLTEEIFSQLRTAKCKLIVRDSSANIDTFSVSALYADLLSMPNVKVILEREYERQRFLSNVSFLDVLSSKLTDQERSLLASVL